MGSDAQRKRQERQRKAARVTLGPRLPMPLDYADEFIRAGLITEDEATRVAGIGRGMAMAIDDWIKGQRAKREATASPQPAWFTYSKFGPPLTLAEKRAWIEREGLSGCGPDLVAERIRERGLEARWFGR
jgi:hypothetical protein